MSANSELLEQKKPLSQFNEITLGLKHIYEFRVKGLGYRGDGAQERKGVGGMVYIGRGKFIICKEGRDFFLQLVSENKEYKQNAGCVCVCVCMYFNDAIKNQNQIRNV